jgi:hypothetical protein
MKELKDFPGYFVTEDGRVFSGRKNDGKVDYNELKEKKTRLDSKKKYVIVDLRKENKKYTKSVHRLVAETYINNPNNLPQVNHIDEDKTNNHVNNLEWCSCQYNIEYSHSKHFIIITPTGESMEVFNMRKFCRENNLTHSNLITNGHAKGYYIKKGG